MKKLALKKLLTYMKSVYKSRKNQVFNGRKRKSIPLFNIVMPLLLFLMLSISFHTIFQPRKACRKD